MKRLVVVTVAASLLGACASSATKLTDLGAGAYSMTKRSGFAGQRSMELQSQLEVEALKVCSDRGLALTMLDTRVVDPDPPAYASATIQFRCVPR